MNTKAFVYLWYDAKNKMYYLGSSIGKKPSYAHSSTVMEKFTLKTKPPYIHRRILATGTHLEMKNLEKKLLDNRKERCWDKYYNKTTQFPPPPMRGEDHPMFGRTGEASPNFGKKLPLETRKKISEAKLGKKFSLEHRRKLSEAKSGKNHPNFGKKLSLEACNKMSEAIRGPKNPNFGKKASLKTRKKMSEARRGDKNPMSRKNREARREKAERLENAIKGNE